MNNCYPEPIPDPWFPVIIMPEGWQWEFFRINGTIYHGLYYQERGVQVISIPKS